MCPSPGRSTKAGDKGREQPRLWVSQHHCRFSMLQALSQLAKLVVQSNLAGSDEIGTSLDVVVVGFKAQTKNIVNIAMMKTMKQHPAANHSAGRPILLRAGEVGGWPRDPWLFQSNISLPRSSV
mmetsp:Transcript_12905/g.28650  ORF Transcript_12905/g.28650 Transcript_12905/m.28650 type:complete len:124 (-) Transcript_12905:295-666(-)